MSDCTCAFPCGGTEDTCPSSPGYGQLVRSLFAERRQMDRTLSACANERDTLRAQLAEAHALLREVEGCPWVVDEATVPKAGIEAAPQQVVGTMHVGLMRLRKIRAVLSGSAAPVERCARSHANKAGRVLKLEEIVAELERYSGTPDGPVLELLQRVADLNEDLKRGKRKSLITQRVFAINEVLWPIAIEYPE